MTRALAVALTAAALAGCRTATEVTLELSTDVECASLGGVAVAVGRPVDVETRAPAAVSTSCAPDGRLGSLVVVPSGADDADFAVKVVAGLGRPPDQCRPPDYDGCIVARRSMRFVPHEGLRLPIALRVSCRSIPCGLTQTCVAGNCRSAAFDPRVCTGAGCDETELTPVGQLACTPNTTSCDGLTLLACGRDQRWSMAQVCRIGCGPRGCLALAGVALSWSSSCAWFDDGSARCWGKDDAGQLGSGAAGGAGAVTTFPRRVAALMTIRQMALGDRHACALLNDGAVACWGDNAAGQLGDGTTTPRATPIPVMGLGRAAEVAAGEKHTCARLVDGTVACWGDNAAGQLGDGTTAPRARPVGVVGLTGATRLALGQAHGCAVVAGGAVRCWGRGVDGQLGNGGNANSGTPVATGTLNGVVDISAGQDHTCVVGAGGVWCWGQSVVGETGTPNFARAPARVNGLAGVAAVALGIQESCALRAAGTVACWGRAAPANTDRVMPHDVPEISAAVRLWAAGHRRCVLDRDGVLACWGDNSTGQAGVGSTADVAAPRPVAW